VGSKRGLDILKWILPEAEQARRVLAQDQSLGLVAEIVAVAHGRHRPRKDRVIVRKVGSEHDLVSADDVYNVRNLMLVWIEEDEVLEAVGAGSRHRLGKGSFVEADGHAQLFGARPEGIVDWIRPQTAAVGVGPHIDDLETKIGHSSARLRDRSFDVEQRHLRGAVEAAGG